MSDETLALAAPQVLSFGARNQPNFRDLDRLYVAAVQASDNSDEDKATLLRAVSGFRPFARRHIRNQMHQMMLNNGMVTETGAISGGFDWAKLIDWVKVNLLPLVWDWLRDLFSDDE